MMTTTIEHVTYQTVENADQGLLDKCNEQINAFCLSQPGFLYRSISKNQNDIWHDIVYWQDFSSAENAAKQFSSTQVCQSLSKLVKQDTMKMQHMQALSEAMHDNA